VQHSPSAGSSTSGRSIVAWVDSRQEGDLDGIYIFAQRFAADGSKIGSNILVNDDPAGFSTVQAEPACDISSNGQAVVVWRDQRNGQDDIYCQIYTVPGFPSGDNFRINQHDYPCYQPRVGVLNESQFAVAWRTQIDSKSYVMFQIVSMHSQWSGDNLMIPVDSSVNQQLDFDLAVHPTLRRIVLAWVNQSDDEKEIHSMVLGLDGDPLSGVKIISPLPDLGFDRIRVDMDAEDYYAVTWTDQRSGIKKAYQTFVDNSGVVLGNTMVSRFSGVSRDEYPAVAVDGRNAITVWCDNRNPGQGYDLYINSTVYNSTDAADDNDLPLPLTISLDQNYPNPFNPSTTIRFDLDREYQQVSLNVVNLLGQTVHSEAYHNLSAGQHEIVFDAEGLSSGVYFYRLTAGDKQISKKMTLLK
jgi:hypothetical protein